MSLLTIPPKQRASSLVSAFAIATAACASQGQVSPSSDVGPPPHDASADAQVDSGPEVQHATLQRVIVLANNDATFKADLYAFERTDGAWAEAFRYPVTIGRNGLGWGLGLHSQAEIPDGEPIKHEGDGKAPMGMFALPQAWGYLPTESVDTKLPYAVATSNLLCIDDVDSEYYNRVVDREAVGLSAADLPSHEDMLRGDDLYKYTIFVSHNTPAPQPGAGSCIFLHVWGDADSSTAGCTAMAEQDLVRLLGWLAPAKSPLLVQLTLANYERLASSWDLPNIELP
jgi:zinc D-Ala-D-Ala dipeptidase